MNTDDDMDVDEGVKHIKYLSHIAPKEMELTNYPPLPFIL